MCLFWKWEHSLLSLSCVVTTHYCVVDCVKSLYCIRRDRERDRTKKKYTENHNSNHLKWIVSCSISFKQQPFFVFFLKRRKNSANNVVVVRKLNLQNSTELTLFSIAFSIEMREKTTNTQPALASALKTFSFPFQRNQWSFYMRVQCVLCYAHLHCLYKIAPLK